MGQQTHYLIFGFINFFISSQAGISDEESHDAAKAILLVIGEFFQIQVSYM